MLTALYAKRHEKSLFGSSASNKMQLPGHHDAAASIGTHPPLHEDCVEPNNYRVLRALCCHVENAILLKNGRTLSGVSQAEVDVLEWPHSSVALIALCFFSIRSLSSIRAV
jgi:hypothetical protein